MAATQTTATSRQLVVFDLDGSPYALAIEHVQEIIRYTEPRQVASGSAWIEGVISLRGKIVPVCNLAARLGLEQDRSEPRERSNIVIVDTDAGTAGVMVDGVDEVVTVDPGQLDDAPGAADAAVQGIAKLGDRLVVLLDPVALFAGLDVQGV